MRMQENEIWTLRKLRAAAPATAREVIRASTESLGTTNAVSDGAAAGLDRITRLRTQVQQGLYQVNLGELSALIVEKHLKTAAR